MSDNSNQKNHLSAPVAIIGFGTAGMNAAIGLRDAGYKGKIDVYSNIGNRPYSPILTSYYVAGEKTYEECFPWLEEEIAELDLDIHGNSAVSHIDVDAHTIQTDDGEHHYSKCVIATGSRPLANGFPEDCGYSPLMLRNMKDAEAMKTAFENEKCQKVLISGASMVALKTLEAALANGLETVLVGMNDNLLDFNALPQVAARFEDGLRDRDVELVLGQTIKSVEVVENENAYKGRKLRVIFSHGKIDEYDEICVAHGMACNLDFLDEGTVDMSPGIIVDDYMRSSDPDVYAAGDVSQAYELVSGKKQIVGIWKNAVNQGQLAGRSIAKELAGETLESSDRYKGSISSNTIAVDGMLFISGGTIDLRDGKTVNMIADENMTLMCIFDPSRANKDGEKSLVGFNLACDTDEAGIKAYDIGVMLSMRIEKDCKR